MSDDAKVCPKNINVEALHQAYEKVCLENAGLRRRVADLEDFLTGAARQFRAMAGKP